MSELTFQMPTAMIIAGVAIAGLLAWFAWSLQRHRLKTYRIVTMLVLRTFFLIILVLLVARPVWTAPEPEDQDRDRVVVLIDDSQSMSVLEGDQSRYEQAVAFARDSLLPLVDQSKLEIRPMMFSEEVREVDGEEIAYGIPDGPSTNLGRAIVHSVISSDPPPLLTVALTDGIVTDTDDHSRAVAALVTNAVPVVAIGFGSQTGARIISLENVDAPALAEPGQSFRVTARLQATGDSIPGFELLLIRDGKLIDRQEVRPRKGPSTWTESFEVASESEGLHNYAIRVMPPTDNSVKLSRSESSALVRVASSTEMRVLYVQGGLTWDYKFIHIALRNDPSIRLSGLSRTASTSRFFENVQSDGDLIDGFPDTIEKISRFRVVILSNLRPGDLTPNQQELLAKYCGELGGGLLMIGGQQTFNGSWRGSRLEELLPVKFSVLSNLRTTRDFPVVPTELAIKHPVFQLSDEQPPRSAWNDLPRFKNRAVVEEVKPGSEIWLTGGGSEQPVLMASQRYGNGFATVICMQNLWRWRLARESNPDHYDRFWRQLLRYMAEAGRESIRLTLANPLPRPGDQIEMLLESRFAAGQSSKGRRRVRIRIQDPDRQMVLDKPIEFETGGQATASFRAANPGGYSAIILDSNGNVLTNRMIEVRDVATELATTALNMETLHQFARISGGVALEANPDTDFGPILQHYLEPERPPQLDVSYAVPAGTSFWSLILLLTCISAEWIFRKKWGML